MRRFFCLLMLLTMTWAFVGCSPSTSTSKKTTETKTTDTKAEKKDKK